MGPAGQRRTGAVRGSACPSVQRAFGQREAAHETVRAGPAKHSTACTQQCNPIEGGRCGLGEGSVWLAERLSRQRISCSRCASSRSVRLACTRAPQPWVEQNGTKSAQPNDRSRRGEKSVHGRSLDRPASASAHPVQLVCHFSDLGLQFRTFELSLRVRAQASTSAQLSDGAASTRLRQALPARVLLHLRHSGTRPAAEVRSRMTRARCARRRQPAHDRSIDSIGLLTDSSSWQIRKGKSAPALAAARRLRASSPLYRQSVGSPRAPITESPAGLRHVACTVLRVLNESHI